MIFHTSLWTKLGWALVDAYQWCMRAICFIRSCDLTEPIGEARRIECKRCGHTDYLNPFGPLIEGMAKVAAMRKTAAKFTLKRDDDDDDQQRTH